jgi:hypothetical protein
MKDLYSTNNPSKTDLLNNYGSDTGNYFSERGPAGEIEVFFYNPPWLPDYNAEYGCPSGMTALHAYATIGGTTYDYVKSTYPGKPAANNAVEPGCAPNSVVDFFQGYVVVICAKQTPTTDIPQGAFTETTCPQS